MRWISRTVTAVLVALACVAVAWAQDTTATGGGGGSPIQSFFSFANDPQWKLALAFVGGFIMRAVPWIENKGIPIALQSMNVLAVLLGALFGASFKPGAVTAWVGNLEPSTGAIMAMGIFGGLSIGALLDAVASVALASGVQSQVKNAAQWWRMGRRILKAVP